MKRIKQLLLLVLCLVALTGCSKDGEGVQLSVTVGDTPVSLDPAYAEVTGDQSILTGLYENLMRVSSDPSGARTVVNGMAKSVSQKENFDGTVEYTFKLRSARWSDGRPVKAEDFVYAWQRLASPSTNSPYASLLSVVSGYDAARFSGNMELLAVTAKNDTTLTVTLDGRYDWFLTEVCTSPATVPLRQDVVQQLKEANRNEEDYTPWWSNPALLVTNGPYVVDFYDGDEGMLLKANPEYERVHDGPDQLRFLFAPDAEAAWAMYEEKEVDLVWPLPQEELEKLAEDDKRTPVPELATHAILFNYQLEELADPMVREAMTLALDRNALAAIHGAGTIPAEGLVPPGVPQSQEGDFRTLGGPLLDNDPEDREEQLQEARRLLDEAGYLRGKSLQNLEYLYVDEGTNGAVAREICRTWEETLNLQVTPRGVTELELWTAMREGSFQLVGIDLTAPGNDAECVLMQWTSDSFDNLVGYENSAYDTLMNVIATAGSEMARMGCLHDAEELLLSDHVLTPLYTPVTGWQLRDDLTGLSRDPRGWFSLSEVTSKNG